MRFKERIESVANSLYVEAKRLPCIFNFPGSEHEPRSSRLRNTGAEAHPIGVSLIEGEI
jgi:hypothetical protein